jgi:hypothetical protein
MSKYDWRADIKGIDYLYDVDPLQQMIFLRHQYLLTSKDMMSDDWNGQGLEACKVVEALEAAIEAQVGNVADLMD